MPQQAEAIALVTSWLLLHTLRGRIKNPSQAAAGFTIRSTPSSEARRCSRTP